MAASMPFVLNAVAPGQGATKYARLLHAAAASIGTVAEVDWLARDHAFDVAFANKPDQTLALARAEARDNELDVNVVPGVARKKRLLVADMESTIIDCECLDELAEIAGIRPQVGEITRRAMSGEIAFEDALRERVQLLKGLKLEALERVSRERVRLNRGAKELVATMRANGAHTMLVSGGFTFFASRVAKEAGFDTAQANTLLDDGVALTGYVREPILGRHAKRETLERAVTEMRVLTSDAMAVGDGANDLEMVRHAGLGVAWHAKPILADAARVRIDHGDLSALLYLQGYREHEIVRTVS